MKLHEVAGEEPLAYTLIKQRLRKGETVWIQRTSRSSGGEQRLFPIKSIMYDTESHTMLVMLSESYRITEHGKPDRIGYSPQKMTFDNTHDIVSTRWTLSKGIHGWVFHVNTTEPTDRIDGEE